MGLRIIGGSAPFGSLALADRYCVGPAESSFDPLSLSPYFWYTNSGVDAGAWEDVSGNGHSASQVSPASRPAIVTGQNGLQVRRFDGVNDFFALSAPTVTQPLEYWIAYSSSMGNVFAKLVMIGSCEVIGFDHIPLDGIDSIYGGSNAASFIPSESFQILRIVFNGASSSVSRNGTGLTISVNPGTGGISGTGYIGTNAGAGGFAAADIGDFGVFPALSNEDAAALTAHFLAKWGVAP